jgi:hypothetical protein
VADYCTSEQIAGFGHEFAALSASSPTNVDLLVTAASRLFDNLTGVEIDFYAPAPDPAAYTVRNYYGNGTGYLPLDPYTELNPVEAVVVDPDHAYDIPDYIEKDGMLIHYATYVGKNVGWNDGVRVAVSANWGFVETPADVQIACVHLAYHLWRTADPAFSQIVNLDNSVAVRTVPEVAQQVVNAYKGKFTQASPFV